MVERMSAVADHFELQCESKATEAIVLKEFFLVQLTTKTTRKIWQHKRHEQSKSIKWQ